jgi:hypothetical protein
MKYNKGGGTRTHPPERGAPMSGYMTCMGTCFGCKTLFTFAPTKVPSYQGAPICKHCITTVNARRAEAGLPLWPVLPGAYEGEEA